jgi:hypothetical protein
MLAASGTALLAKRLTSDRLRGVAVVLAAALLVVGCGPSEREKVERAAKTRWHARSGTCTHRSGNLYGCVLLRAHIPSGCSSPTITSRRSSTAASARAKRLSTFRRRHAATRVRSAAPVKQPARPLASVNARYFGYVRISMRCRCWGGAATGAS